jgi:hypothetical protein
MGVFEMKNRDLYSYSVARDPTSDLWLLIRYTRYSTGTAQRALLIGEYITEEAAIASAKFESASEVSNCVAWRHTSGHPVEYCTIEAGHSGPHVYQ